jgi:predicted Zn-dependent protease
MGTAERRQQLAALLHDDPHDPFLRYALAMELTAAGQRVEALAELALLLAHAPDYVPAYLQAGKLSAEAGADQEARRYFTEGIAQARRQSDAHAVEEMQGMLLGLG